MHLKYEADLNEPDSDSRMGCFSSNAAFYRKNRQYSQKLRNYEQKNQHSKKNIFHLKNLITQNKVKILTKNFVSKLNLNNVMRKPPHEIFEAFEMEEEIGFWNRLNLRLQKTNGIELNNIALTIWSCVNIIQITVMVFMISIMVTFNEDSLNDLYTWIRVVSVILYLLDMILNSVTQRYENGKKLINLKDIIKFYLQNGFIIDLISILTFPLDIAINSTLTILFSFIVLFKLFNNIRKFEKLQYLYITTNEKQQYYGLIKVFLTNFSIGHLLSVCLNLMALINTSNNWQTKFGIAHDPWFAKYIWGYYWGTNIMLTVGFGDITAATHHEALVLIFIETLSCITLAYNINNVGALISSIRASEDSKKKKLKMYSKMSEENQIDANLNSQITNFIEESFHIKESFEFDEQEKVLQFLPKELQSEYRSQSNKILFDKIGFLKNLSPKILVVLAENVVRKIAHPEQFFKKKGEINNFCIIQKGGLGSYYRRGTSALNGSLIEKIQINSDEKPKIFSLDFIKAKRYNFDIKSIGYSILYYLEIPDFIKCLKELELDYQLFCVMKDRDENILGQNQVYPCEICKTEYHSKFKCSKVHYIPLGQHIINCYLKKKQVCTRFPLEREKKSTRKNQLLINYNKLKEIQKKYISHRFSPVYFEKIEKVRKYTENMKKIKKIEFDRSRFIDHRYRWNTSENVPADNSDITQSKTLNDAKYYEQIKEDQKNINGNEGNFGSVDVDQIFNFKYYFTNYNPDNIYYEKGLKNQKLGNKFLSI